MGQHHFRDPGRLSDLCDLARRGVGVLQVRQQIRRHVAESLDEVQVDHLMHKHIGALCDSNDILGVLGIATEDHPEFLSASNRYAKDWNTGPCGTRMALTDTRSSSKILIGCIDGAVLDGLAPAAAGTAISWMCCLSLMSLVPLSRMKTL